jgi:glycosyltransferase involved in cell wall biosynthesis
MRILFITSTTELHGSTLSLLSLLDGVINKGDFPFVIVPDTKGPLCNILKNKSIPFFKIPLVFFCYPSPRPHWRRWFIFDIKNMISTEYNAEKKLIKIVKEVKPDLIHTNVGPIVTGHFVAKKHNIPHIWHIREYGDLDFNMKMFPCKSFYRKALASDYPITITHSLLSYHHLLDSPKATVIYNGVCNKNSFSYTQDKEPYFLCASRVSPEKKIDEVIEAFADFKKKHFNFKLIILGDAAPDYKQKLTLLVESLECSDSVLFEGFQHNVMHYMEKATALIVASPAEGFGRMTAEAICAGSIVIGKKAGGTQEIIQHTAGFLYTDNKDLLNCMEKAAKLTEEEYTTIVKRGQEKAKKLFSIEEYVENVYNVYEKALKERKNAL